MEVTRTILLVEDDNSVRKLIASILAIRGYLVLPTADAASALAASDSHAGPIDMVITDFGLGEVNGLDLAARIAGMRPGIRILIISGYTDLPLPEELKSALRSGFLPKPFTMDVLLSRVDALMDGEAPPKRTALA